MKLLVRFLLLICLLVSGGYGYLHTHTHRDPVIPTFKPAQPGTEKESYKLKATEVEEDDELVCFRKHADNTGSYFTTFYYTQAPGSFSDPLDKALPFGKYFFHSSAPRYIMYRVIRI